MGARALVRLAAPILATLTAAAAAHGQQRAVPADHAERFERGTKLFTEEVAPILVARCFKCHGGDVVRGQFDLTTRDGLLAGSKNGGVVEPFDAADSRLLKLVRHEEAPAMPFKSESMPDAEIAKLSDWIDLGAPYAAPLAAEGAEKGGKAATRGHSEVSAADRAFWSFRRLERPAPPDVADAAWCRTPVDRFVRARQEAAGAKPAADASRRVLARRTWFDLLGVPPTAEEVAHFESDAAPDAWPRLVNRLLADPRFGERWGRHWLDVARFAESHGFEHDTDRPNAWTYRDFVIRALDRDLPFDQFVRWQIAGDELVPDDADAWFATGFLGCGVHATQITASQVEKERYDELDDVVATIGTGMLGLTIGCARCHDHKFDPIPTRDYYRMVATFTKTVRSDFDVVTNAAEWRAQTAKWEEEQAPLAAELAQFEKEDAPGRFDAWLGAKQADVAKAAADESAAAPWVVVQPAGAIVSTGGATFTGKDDDSWIAEGERAEHDAYRFRIAVDRDLLGRADDAARIAAVRIEALADPSLPHGGPGRADNGNFGLTELTATFTPNERSGDPSGDDPPKGDPVAFARARSTFDQAGLPVAAAIDGNDAPDSACWAVDPQFGRDHAAVFEFAAPLDPVRGGVLELTLHFDTNVGHSIGRLRVSLAADAAADLRAPARSAAVAAAFTRLAHPTPADRELLAKHVRERDPDWRALHDAVVAHESARPRPKTQKALICSEGVPAIRLHTQGGDFLDATHFLKRGDPGQKLEVATPAFLQVLTRAEDGERRWQVAPPAGSRTPLARAALARWLTDVDDGAGSLLARVCVNRLWQHLFGRGIVATPSDFGTTGDKPSHPELLDWLACELVESGWSVKHVLALLATSRVYLESGGDDAVRASDPEERLFARHPARRLEAECVRDAMLAVSGRLDPRMYGASAADVADPRRSVYLFAKRSRLVPMLSLFDAPNALSGVGRRQVTTIAPQSLFLMNHPVVRDWAAAFARRLDERRDDAGFVRGAYALAFARAPTDDELADAVAFLAGQARARADFCQALFSAHEFVYVE
jgi:hypothetical protein